MYHSRWRHLAGFMENLMGRSPLRHGKACFAVLAAGLLLSACAGVQENRQGADHAAVFQAIARQDCQAARRALDDPGLVGVNDAMHARARLETAFVCLTTGDHDAAWEQSLAFAAEFGSHPDLDYAHYVAGMSRFMSWRDLHASGSVPDPALDARLARESFVLFRDLVRDFPDSRHVDEVIPHLLELREGLAAIELRLARQDLQQGNQARGQARIAYIREYYAATLAARESWDLMSDSTRE